MRICAIGDSFVNGVGDAAGLGWIGRLLRPMKALNPDVTLYNLGVRGDTSSDIRTRWRREVDVRSAPGLDIRLIFSFGVNDCCPDENGLSPRVAADDAIANAFAILGEARALGSTLMIGPPPIAIAEINERTAALDPLLAETAKRAAVPYLPVFKTLHRSDVWMTEVARFDDAHPGSDGYAELAELVAAWPEWKAWRSA